MIVSEEMAFCLHGGDLSHPSVIYELNTVEYLYIYALIMSSLHMGRGYPSAFFAPESIVSKDRRPG